MKDAQDKLDTADKVAASLKGANAGLYEMANAYLSEGPAREVVDDGASPHRTYLEEWIQSPFTSSIGTVVTGKLVVSLIVRQNQLLEQNNRLIARLVTLLEEKR